MSWSPSLWSWWVTMQLLTGVLCDVVVLSSTDPPQELFNVVDEHSPQTRLNHRLWCWLRFWDGFGCWFKELPGEYAPKVISQTIQDVLVG